VLLRIALATGHLLRRRRSYGIRTLVGAHVGNASLLISGMFAPHWYLQQIAHRHWRLAAWERSSAFLLVLP
jgi:hypothetical protein